MTSRFCSGRSPTCRCEIVSPHGLGRVLIGKKVLTWKLPRSNANVFPVVKTFTPRLLKNKSQKALRPRPVVR